MVTWMGTPLRVQVAVDAKPGAWDNIGRARPVYATKEDAKAVLYLLIPDDDFQLQWTWAGHCRVVEDQ